MPFLKPLMPQTHIVPGFRLGPDLPICQLSSERSEENWHGDLFVLYKTATAWDRILSSIVYATSRLSA